jgi:hypothetical protein
MHTEIIYSEVVIDQPLKKNNNHHSVEKILEEPHTKKKY